MRAIQGSFLHLINNISCEEQGDRFILLQLVVLLHNFKNHRIGMNQITNSFIPHLLLDSEYFSNEYYLNIINEVEDVDQVKVHAV